MLRKSWDAMGWKGDVKLTGLAQPNLTNSGRPKNHRRSPAHLNFCTYVRAWGDTVLGAQVSFRLVGELLGDHLSLSLSRCRCCWSVQCVKCHFHSLLNPQLNPFLTSFRFSSLLFFSNIFSQSLNLTFAASVLYFFLHFFHVIRFWVALVQEFLSSLCDSPQIIQGEGMIFGSEYWFNSRNFISSPSNEMELVYMFSVKKLAS